MQFAHIPMVALIFGAMIWGCSTKEDSKQSSLDSSQYEIMLRSLDVSNTGNYIADKCTDVNVSIVERGTKTIVPSPEELKATLTFSKKAQNKASDTPSGEFFTDNNCSTKGSVLNIGKDTNGQNGWIKATSGDYTVTVDIDGYSLQSTLRLVFE